jgi:Protein of unknown function (DUF2933)
MALHERCGHDRPGGSLFASSAGLVLIGFLLLAGVLLFTEHRAHLLGALIYVPLLLCPLMHFFMHGGHRGHGTHDQEHHERSAP